MAKLAHCGLVQTSKSQFVNSADYQYRTLVVNYLKCCKRCKQDYLVWHGINHDGNIGYQHDVKRREYPEWIARMTTDIYGVDGKPGIIPDTKFVELIKKDPAQFHSQIVERADAVVPFSTKAERGRA
jgi:hypothetical protein